MWRHPGLRDSPSLLFWQRSVCNDELDRLTDPSSPGLRPGVDSCSMPLWLAARPPGGAGGCKEPEIL
jgi:hypothetical protein